ncbi:MAG: RNB domain-containing ribonuclease, partial [Pseudomonadota bacterium]
RVHDEPAKEKLEALQETLKTTSLSLAKGQVIKPAVFNRLIERAAGTAYEPLIGEMVLRSQSQAAYAPDNIGHFGLNLGRYAHFTSPIRRYADLIVHRGLIAAHTFGADGLNEEDASRLGQIAEDISSTERRALAAERDSTDRYMAAYMEPLIGQEFRVRIVGVTRFGLFVRVERTGADGLVPMRALPDEFFKHDAKGHRLVGERSGLVFRLGDTLDVRLEEAAPLSGGLRFSLLGEYKTKGSAKRRSKKRSAKAGAQKSDTDPSKKKSDRHGRATRSKKSAKAKRTKRER